MMWNVEHTVAFEEWWETLAEDEQDDVTAIVELLMEQGVNLPYPFSSKISGSKFSHMRELRVQSHGDPFRVFYAFDPARTAILLIGGNKTGDDKRFYKKHIKIADKMYQEHLDKMEAQSDT